MKEEEREDRGLGNGQPWPFCCQPSLMLHGCVSCVGAGAGRIGETAREFTKPQFAFCSHHSTEGRPLKG